MIRASGGSAHLRRWSQPQRRRPRAGRPVCHCCHSADRPLSWRFRPRWRSPYTTSSLLSRCGVSQRSRWRQMASGAIDELGKACRQSLESQAAVTPGGGPRASVNGPTPQVSIWSRGLEKPPIGASEVPMSDTWDAKMSLWWWKFWDRVVLAGKVSTPLPEGEERAVRREGGPARDEPVPMPSSTVHSVDNGAGSVLDRTEAHKALMRAPRQVGGSWSRRRGPWTT